MTALENTKENKEYIDGLQKIYLVGCWARYGIMEFPFAGEYREYDVGRGRKMEVPMVWDYDDCNGTSDAYYLRPIHRTTTGIVYDWTFDKEEAMAFAARKNKERGFEG